ncbi:MAG: hypothetical protein HKN12_08150 [Gemmatimonadetes bacterium]|nr:hypothetical protein [Gemmatimonadota bacterium]
MSTETESRTVRAVEWTLQAPGRLDRAVTTLPAPTQEEVLVATQVGAISPGTERTLVHGTNPAVPERSYPYQPGYLNVVSIEQAADRTLIGDRGVTCLGHRDYALIPYTRFIRIPFGITDEVALLGILAADARHAIEVAAVERDEDCLVIGGGIMGVLTAWELSLRTKGAVRLVENNADRRRLLKEIVFPSQVKVSDRPGRYPFHTTFDCASTSAAFQVAQDATRAGGSVVVVADGSHDAYILSSDFFSKGLFLGKTDSSPDLRGFLNEWFVRSDNRETLVAAAFRHEVRFDEYPQAYLKCALSGPADQAGLLTRVLY